MTYIVTYITLVITYVWKTGICVTIGVAEINVVLEEDGKDQLD